MSVLAKVSILTVLQRLLTFFELLALAQSIGLFYEKMVNCGHFHIQCRPDFRKIWALICSLISAVVFIPTFQRDFTLSLPRCL